MAAGWLGNPTSVYCLVALLALARAMTLSGQQQAQQPQLQQQAQQQHRHRVEGQQANLSPAPDAGGAGPARRRPHSGPNSAGHTNKTSAGRALQLSTRIETLDDVSHKLDQATVRPPPPLELDDTRVPFWNIAHMVNSIEQVALALGAGANGIETDVSFDAAGRPVEAYHGFPCDCGRHCHHREDLVKFVRHLGRLAASGVDGNDDSGAGANRLLVVLFDLKLKELRETHQKETAGALLAELLHRHLFAELARGARREGPLGARVPPRVIISINHAHDLPLTRAFLNYVRAHRLDQLMGPYVGWDVGMNDPLGNITRAWASMGPGATTNIWQGDGLTNCANIVRGVERLKGAIEVRNNQGPFRKVYYWTADVLYHMRAVLRLGVDAMLTNQPQRAVQVLREPEFRRRYRLATPWDDPFTQFWIQPTSSGLPLPSLGEINETVVNIHKTGENFIKTLPDGLAAALKKVQSAVVG